MRTKIFMLCITAMAVAGLVSSGSVQQSADQLYQSGMYKEDIEGQLEEAIAIYRQIIEEFPNDGPIAAKAWFHIGLCYEKLGNQEAQRAYQQVLSNYAEQKEIASQARARLNALAKAAEAVASAPKFRQIEIPGKPPINSAAMLSPDGNHFAFLAEGDIWTVPVSGGVHPNIAGEPVRLTKGMGAWEAGNCAVTWSTDGQWIAFRAKPNDSVYLVPASGGEPRRVDGISSGDYGGAQMARVSVSKAGARIAFPTGSSGLSTIPGEGGRATQLVSGRAYEPAFSPNGKLIAYIKGEQKGTDLFESIMVVPADGGEPVLVSSMPGGGHLTDSPTWSPDGRMIAFPVGRKESSEMWIVPLSSSGRPEGKPTTFDLKPIVEAKLRGKSVFKFMDPLGGWSRKNEIAFLLQKPVDSAIYRVPAAGGRATMIGLDGREPRWAPDGKRVYFRGKTNIESVAAEGGDEKSVPIRYKTPLIVWFPTGSNEVSKDGRNIVFAGGYRRNEQRPGEDGIYAVPSQGGKARPIVIPASGYARNPSWSPDGKRIAYTMSSPAPDGKVGIWISPYEGGTPKQLTSDADQVSEGEVRWSPDGKTIAYFGADKTLQLIPSAGGSSRVIAKFTVPEDYPLGFCGLSWSPDGTKLVYTTFQKVWVIPASGGEPKEIPVGFDGSRIQQIDWSPDGKTLAFTGVSGAEEEVWLMSDFLHLVKTGESQMARQSARERSKLTNQLIWKTGNPGNCRNAASPDGKYITYIDNSGNLAIRDLKAETGRLLTNEGSMNYPYQSGYSSRWSRDGKQVAYNWEKETENQWQEQLRILTLEDPKPRVVFLDNDKGAWVEPQDWAPDGRQILARLSREGRADQLALIPVQGGSPKVIKTLEPGAVSSGMAFFSPDGRYVVYDRPPGKVAALDLFILDLAGGGETSLIRHPADDRLLGWSPDGNWILFLSDRSGTPGLWVIKVSEGKPQGSPLSVRPLVSRLTPLGFTKDGSFYYMDTKGSGDIYTADIDLNTGKLTTQPEKAIWRYEGWNMGSRYSPDGKSLAYISRRGLMVWPPNRGNALCIHSLESGTERVFMDEFVSFGISRIIRPRWSSDSRSIMVMGRKAVGDIVGFYRVNLDTGKISTLIESSPDIQYRQCDFAQDGRHFFYLRKDKVPGIWTIQVSDLQNGKERELYRHEGELWGLSISPDGKWLATVADRLILSVIPTGEGIPRTVHHFDQLKEIWEPEWTPDGKYILFGISLPEGKEGKILYKIPVEGGKPQEILFPQGFAHRPTVHPNGRRIAFDCVEGQSSDAEVWVIQNFLPTQ